jgi:predicted PurR-regulated permease PerM
MTPDPPQPGKDATVQRAGKPPRVLVIGAVAALALLVWQLADLLLLLFGAIILATALRALAAPLHKYLHLSPRTAVLVTVVVGVIATVAGMWMIGDRLAAQFGDLRERVPEALTALTTWLNSHPIGVEILAGWEEVRQESPPWGRFASLAGSTLGAFGSISLMCILGVYLAVDPVQYRQGFVRMIPPDYRSEIDGALVATGEALAKWLKGQGISMLFVGVATAVGLAALQVPLALSVGVIAGALAFIPFFGPIASGILAVMLAFIEGPDKALYVAGLCVAIQQIEGNLLMPLVQRWAVKLPPVLGITAAVIFGILFGIVGVLFATPLMVVVMVLVQKLYIEAFLESGPADARQ